MLKVAIIDDEPVIRRGIRNMIDWDELGCEVCGEAADGKEGQKLIDRARPSIIITDIRMPETDGLSMIRSVKEAVPNCKIIILTGFRNFEYAQEAIRLGAFDFIMKPTKIDELKAVLRRAVSEVKSRKENTEEIGQLRQQRRKSEQIVRERILYDTMLGMAGKSEGALESTVKLEAELRQYVLALLVLKASDAPDTKEAQDEQPSDLPKAEQILKGTFDASFAVSCVALGSNSAACVISLPEGPSSWKATLSRDCMLAQLRIEEACQMSAAISISDIASGLESLPVKLKECRKTLDYRFLLGKDAVAFYSDMKELSIQDKLAYLGESQSRLLEHIFAGDMQGIHADTADILQCLKSSKQISWSCICNFYFDTILRIYSIRRELSKNSDGFAGLFSMIEGSKNVQSLTDLLDQIASQEVELIRKRVETPSFMLRKALRYIDQHFCEDIALGDVAAQIFASPCYTSHLFKKELGVNFVDYLNKLRINRAKDMLSDSHYKIYEVAEAVGIANEHYFSKLFKRYIGMTATEFRQGAV